MDMAEIKKLKGESQVKEETTLYKITKWVLVVAIILVSLELLTKPLRRHWADNYLDQGDQYLLQKKYLSAELDYQKSLALFDNQTAKDHLDLAKSAETNILALEKFYQEHKISDEIDNINFAKTKRISEYEELQASKALFDKGEYQLALIPLQEIKDPTTPEYKTFLKTINSSIAEKVEISAVARQKYLD